MFNNIIIYLFPPSIIKLYLITMIILWNDSVINDDIVVW